MNDWKEKQKRWFFLSMIQTFESQLIKEKGTENTMKYLTVEEIKNIMQVSSRTVYNNIREGKLKAIKMGKSWRVKEEDFQEFIDSFQTNKKK